MTRSPRQWSLRLLVSLAIGASWAGCKVDDGSGKQAAPAQAAPGTSPEKPAAAVQAPTAPTQAPSANDADPLGKRFMDPPWFRKDLIEGAKSAKTSRSEADSNGFFSSQILFELPEGATAESCADTLAKEVGTTVPGLERETKPDGRIEIKGETDRYTVTLLCGEVEGTVKAYVGYRWVA